MALNLRTNAQATIVDFAVVESGIRKQTVDGRSRGEAFARYVTETIFEVPTADVMDHIVDGANDRGIDIIFIDHKNRTINLGSCKSVAKYEKSVKNFPGSAVDKVIAFVDDIFLKNDRILEEANGFICAKIRDIWSIFEEFENGADFKVKVHLFSNQLTLTKLDRERLVDRLSRYKVDVIEHGLYELVHGVIRASRPVFRKKISSEKDCCFAIEENGHRGWQTRISLNSALKLLTNNETGAFDERLTFHNVRHFLGNDNAVNKEIRDTLVTGRSADFWALNNGLTIVCDQVMIVGTGNHAMTLVNPKIVNGGQTANVLYEVGSNSFLDLRGGSIPIKIIETKDERFIERIAIASNTQSRIFGRDLRAFDSFQEKLAKTISDSGYFYRRKRGEIAPSESLPVIDMARAGQLMLAYVAAEPTKSKTESSDIFDDLYEVAFNVSTTTADLIIAAHLCHKNIEENRAMAVALQRSLSKNSFAETWVIEGHFHVLFVVGELMRRRNISLDNSLKARELIPDAMAIVEKFVNENPRVSAYRLFRLASSTTTLRRSIDQTWSSVPATPVQLSLPF